MMITPNAIYLGDCLDIMQDIPDKSVDAIICDLPYQVLNKSNPNAKWDKIIPFEPLWKQYERIIKDNGAIILFGQGMFTAQLMMSNPKLWRYNLIWSKGRVTGFLNANRMPMRCHEDICVFYKKLPTYNPQMEKCEPHQRNHGRGSVMRGMTNNCYGKFTSTPTVISDEKFPKSIIQVKIEHKNGEFYHPAQKPVNLLRYLIRTYTNENDVILDNAMGSGSTIVAAIREKRQYIGIEKDEKYFEIANERIKNETMQIKLF